MKKILVPTDFSSTADNALRYAVELAKHLNHEIILFHASGILTDTEDVIIREKTLFVRSTYPTVAIESITSPKLFNSQTIRELFGPGTIAFIVMGTQGADAPLEHKIFGTNAAEIVEEAAYPVVVIPHTATFTAIHRIAFASDNQFLEYELPRVIALAKAFKAQLDILHIEESDKKDDGSKAINLRQLLTDTSQSDYDLSVTFTTEKKTRGDDLLDCIEDFVEGKKCDLLVLFHQTSSGISRFFHTGISEKAATNFKFPIVVFQKDTTMSHG